MHMYKFVCTEVYTGDTIKKNLKVEISRITQLLYNMREEPQQNT